ncbi:hypothetical protein QZM81_38185 [Burkholderia cepacia]|uniref:hypothetical protein n=1 Tax=Burkholderia cepacia TaxID=292 RepID=UPI002650EB87|nr:hypothetical protein [Burkholderia cepacia]MDN7861649.1 hypothetical protein [Burkholderia cepacia]
MLSSTRAALSQRISNDCGVSTHPELRDKAQFGQLRSVDGGPEIVDNEAANDVEIADMKNTREFLLPFGIDLRVEAGNASIESNLPEALPNFSDPVENGRIVGVVEGVEQLLLSLARVGIDLSNPLFAQAINDCVANLQSG